jgi:tRNA (guanine26-N2/guanine27-N2)-dimethyltransferase
MVFAGLRSIRYANEIPGIREIIANDVDPSAVAAITRNIKYNNVEHIVKASKNDARYDYKDTVLFITSIYYNRLFGCSAVCFWVADMITKNSMVLYLNRDPLLRFDVVDLDPYGSAAIFLDGAVQAVEEGGEFLLYLIVMRMICVCQLLVIS